MEEADIPEPPGHPGGEFSVAQDNPHSELDEMVKRQSKLLEELRRASEQDAQAAEQVARSIDAQNTMIRSVIQLLAKVEPQVVHKPLKEKEKYHEEQDSADIDASIDDLDHLEEKDLEMSSLSDDVDGDELTDQIDDQQEESRVCSKKKRSGVSLAASTSNDNSSLVMQQVKRRPRNYVKRLCDIFNSNNRQRNMFMLHRKSFQTTASKAKSVMESLIEELNSGVIPPTWWVRQASVTGMHPKLCPACAQPLHTETSVPPLATVVDLLESGTF
jgi:hypothetical protein